jgi:methionine synthase II (cobalamin-independent)
MDKLAGLPLLPTTIVGSYPQPDWLIDRERLKARLPPRVRAAELWRVQGEWLQEAQEAATLIALSDQKLAGIDIAGDGEMRRESPFPVSQARSAAVSLSKQRKRQTSSSARMAGPRSPFLVPSP